MQDPHPTLEYAFQLPAAAEDWHFSRARFLALGYVAACVFGLVVMGVIMALEV